MKITIALGFLLGVLVFLMCTPTGTSTTVSLEGPQIVSIGETITVSVIARDIQQMNAATYSVQYNASVMLLQTIHAGTVNGTLLPLTYVTESGICNVVQQMPNLTGINGSGTLVNLTFLCQTKGTSHITINGAISRNDGTELLVNWSGIDITITNTRLFIDAPDTVTGSFTVSLAIENVQNLSSIVCDIRYNNKLLTISSVNQGAVNGKLFNITYHKDTERIRIIGIADNVNGSGSIIYLLCTPKNAGIANFSIENITMSNTAVEPIYAHTKNATVYITANPPTAQFSYLPATPTIFDTVIFNGSESHDNEGFIESYTWEFGDGTTDVGEVVTHSYDENGDYLVNLTVVDTDGNINTKTVVITIANLAPFADFSYAPEEPITQENILFTDKSYDSDGIIISLVWDFGDGNSSTALSPVHMYSSSGTYIVNLTIRDDDNALAWALVEIVVQQGNRRPEIPASPTPANESSEISVSPLLRVSVNDPDGDKLTVSFYNAVDDSLIGTKSNIPSGSITDTTWSNRAYSTTYLWYVIVSDGLLQTRSNIWQFTTENPPIKYSLTTSVSPVNTGLITVSPQGNSFLAGTMVTLTASPSSGYLFDYWSGSASGGAQNIQIIMNSNKSVQAHFILNQPQPPPPPVYALEITIEPNDGGTVTVNPIGASYNEGTLVSMTAQANDGFLFSHWSGDTSGNTTAKNILMDSSKTIVAHFVESVLPNQKPILTITSPNANTTIFGNISLRGTASDNDGTVQYVQIRIDGSGWITANGTSIWNYNLATVAFTNGPHVISARSFDGTDYSIISSINVIFQNQNIDSDVDGGNGIPLIYLILGGLSAIAVIIVIVMFFVKRR